MGIRFTCHACSKRLNVKAFLAGKRGICPHCGMKVDIPWQSTGAGDEAEATEGSAVMPQSVATAGRTNGAAYSPTAQPSVPVAGKAVLAPATVPMAGPGNASAPVNVVAVPVAPTNTQPVAATTAAPPAPTQPSNPITESPDAVWYVRPPSGGQYGPASGEIMRKWVAEGRVSADSLVWREGWPDWKPADSKFPELSDPGGSAPARVAVSSAAPITAPAAATFSTPAVAAGSEAAGRTYVRRRSNNSLAVILVVLLTLASLGLFGVLIAVIQFMK